MNPYQSGGGYDPEHYEILSAVEDRHFWFRARNQVISILTRQLVSQMDPGYRVLEIGCGNGNVLRFLERVCTEGTVLGMDMHAEGLRYAQARTTCGLVQGDASQSPFAEPFHLIGMFDVLEHIPDDTRILADLSKLLGSGGILFLTVPAHRELWSYFDEFSGHCRRYERNELNAKLKAANFTVDYITDYMAAIYPLMWITRRLRSEAVRANDGSEPVLAGDVRVVPFVNEVLLSVLSLESKWLARRKRFPLGTSLLAIARKN